MFASSIRRTRVLIAWAAMFPVCFGAISAGFDVRAPLGALAAVILSVVIAPSRVSDRVLLALVPVGWLVGLLGWMLPKLL